MKNIRLDCFDKNDFCQITSVEKSFIISNPLEREFILEIANNRSSDCVVKMKPISSLPGNNLKEVDLIITNNEKILFQNDLTNFFAKEIILGSIAKNSSANYFFSIDLLSLILEGKKIIFDFDLLLDFNCEEVIDNSNQVKNQPEISKPKITSASVLSASSSVKEEISSPDSVFTSPFFFLLLSSLFVVIFFVIMKLINGQKKKKQA